MRVRPITKPLFPLLFLLITITLHAGEQIRQYDATATIHPSGELDITEAILYDFDEASRHGIYRDIPFTVKQDGPPKDIGIGSIKVEMDDARVPWKKSTIESFSAGNMIRLKIGSPSVRITGKHRYTIHYHVQKGVFPSSLDSRKDAIRWNAIGTGWRVPIDKANIDLLLPKTLDRSNVTVQIFKGSYGSQRHGGKVQWPGNNHLRITASNFSSHEGLTVEVSYAAGLLGQTGEGNLAPSVLERFLGNWQWGFLGIFLLFLVRFYRHHIGFTDHRSIAPRYYPPEGLSVLQSGVIYDRFAKDDDYAAAILELAQRGYIVIYKEDETSDPFLQKTSKETKDLPEDLKYLMDEVLFKRGKDLHTLKTESDAESDLLENGFFSINYKLYQWSVKEGYMKENPEEVRSKFIGRSALFMVFFLVMAIYTIYHFYGWAALKEMFLYGIYIITGVLLMTQKSMIVRATTVFLLLFGIYYLFVTVPTKALLLSPFPALVIVGVGIYVTYRYLGAYTRKGAEAQKQLLGLKAFMSRVNKDEIERRLKEDPLYLDTLLPYAVLFDLNTHWLKFYQETHTDYPVWYNGSPEYFGDLTSAMQSAATAPTSESGGTSRGGGFSGGGFGGGGGGSW